MVTRCGTGISRSGNCRTQTGKISKGAIAPFFVPCENLLRNGMEFFDGNIKK
jgi:hypothetical protein